MSRSRPLLRWSLLPLGAAALFALDLAVRLMAQAFRAGTQESLLLAWLLAFVVGLPMLLAGLVVVRRAGAWLRRHHIIPNPGENIPGVGQ
jgi:hypothetical protein